MKKLLFAMLVGAALMWFYDPANGAERRESLQRKLNQGPGGAASTPADQQLRLADVADRPHAAMAGTR